MARTAIPEQTFTRNSTPLSGGGFVAGDTVNGHYIPEPLAGMILWVSNADAAPQTLRFLWGVTWEGLQIQDSGANGKLATVPNGNHMVFGGFDQGRIYEQLVPGVTINGSPVNGLLLNVSSANLQMRVFRLPSAQVGA